MNSLPVDALLLKLVAALERSPSVVLQASPGTGKTTRVPPALLAAPFRKPEQEIWVLEPRRLAAKMAARRVAQERGEEVGSTVGYQFRLENVTSARTRVRFLTEGMLMRMLIGDRVIARAAAVVLDEFHERHLHSDLALAALRKLQRTVRPELKLVVMSATLDADSVTRFLGGAPVLKIDAPLHPVDLRYVAPPAARPGARPKPLELRVRDAVLGFLDDSGAGRATPGDALVFLPGMSEIRRAESALREALSGQKVDVLPLHGELSREEQDRAVTPGARRKIILSTNVAETSLTIEGVTAVVDSGLHRQASYSWWSGVPTLKTQNISRASAVQRAGRAGRTAPGVCIRLYSKADFEARAPFDVPEIRRADLAQSLLELRAIGVEDMRTFEWFEPPRTEALEGALEELRLLGALDGRQNVTPLGKQMAEVPAHPRLARLLLEARALGVLEPAAQLAAAIQEGALEGADALEAAHRAAREPAVARAKEHLLRGLKGPSPRATGPKLSERDRLALAVLKGFPDRVARKSRRAGELLLSAGGSARHREDPVFQESETFVALDVFELKDVEVRSVVPIREEWLLDLEPGLIAESTRVEWNAARGRAQEISEITYGKLVLSESRREVDDPKHASRALLEGALKLDATRLAELPTRDVIAALARVTDAEALEAAVARAALAARHAPASGFADLSRAGLGQALLEGALASITSVDELRAIDWAMALVGPEKAALLERLAPAHVTLARGRRARVRYALDQRPWVESRLQDFFGMPRGPAVVNGRVPLTLHLLAPNQRAVQVTTDLEGFWAREYPRLRRELGRRYPRHAWPEDPLAKTE